ncbi:MAG TPA: bifunctional DNA primase/polymerase [Nitrososphaeraceae archaeon]|nr:bifunctional DNA primase/polymerase [Nitrososphaeraceae archaeon]
MTSQSTFLNHWSDYWYYKIGVNITPANTKEKRPFINWSEYQNKSIPEQLHNYWKENGHYNQGISLIPGLIWRGPFEGKYLIAIDLDNKIAIQDFCGQELEYLKQNTIVEQHSDPNKMHIYFIVDRPIPNKASDKTNIELLKKIDANEIPALEVKSSSKYIMFCSNSPHRNGSNYQIIGTEEPTFFDASKVEKRISDICNKYNISYGSVNGSNGNGHLNPISDLWKTDTVILQGHNRHLELLRIMESELQRNRGIKPLEDIKEICQLWNQKHCKPSLDERDFEKQWKAAMEFIARNTADGDINNDDDFYNNFTSNSKISVYKQLSPEIRQHLSEFVCWKHTSLSPPFKFIIAHRDFKQIIHASVKKYKIPKKDGNDDEFETKTKLNLYDIIIDAIPKEITLHKDLLGLSSDNYHKYTIDFVTKSNRTLTIGPMHLDEIITFLRNMMLIPSPTKASESLSTVISAFEEDNKIIVKEDIETPGFYYIDGEIRPYHVDHPKPTFEQIKDCCELLDTLQAKFKKKDVLPTITKWSVIAPFDYVLKQAHKKWIPWPYPYGWSNTGKSTLGDMSSCVWNRYDDKDAIIPYTAADTVARLGESLSKSTYPIVINEVSQLSDDHRKKDVVEMIKATVTDIIGRKKYVNKTTWTIIPALSPCILTGNSTPPKDTGFRRRIIPIVFTEQDQYSSTEMLEFKKIFDDRIKKEFRYLGDFAANYGMENQQIIIDSNTDWKEKGQIILTEFYKAAGKEVPEWTKYFVEETQLEDSKEDVDLSLASFLTILVNETYNKFHRNMEKIATEFQNTTFDNRLEFCLEQSLIPFLKRINVNGTDLIVITSHIINELKQKVPEISSLPEIASIIEGFEYGHKRIGVKLLRTAYGTKKNLTDFLGNDNITSDVTHVT